MIKKFHIDGDEVSLESFNDKIQSYAFNDAKYTPRNNGGEVYSFLNGVTVDLTISTESNEHGHKRDTRTWSFTSKA
jgi:hypothetical protein